MLFTKWPFRAHPMSKYAQRLNEHLARYKARRLGSLEPGTFTYRGDTRSYEHILPKDQQWLNLLEPFRADMRDYLEGERSTIKLHRYFHHLNSSQAFALNLFFPFFAKGGASQLLAALGSEGSLSSWEPECVVDENEGTNVDVTWISGGVRTYCEVKLSEQEFGTAKDDDRHREKLERIYRPCLTSTFSPDLLQPEAFFRNYQLLRNVWLIAREPGARLVFLVPRANTTIWRQLSSFLGMLPNAIATRVRVVAMEDVLESLTAADDLPAALRGYGEVLREKYVLQEAA